MVVVMVGEPALIFVNMGRIYGGECPLLGVERRGSVVEKITKIYILVK